MKRWPGVVLLVLILIAGGWWAYGDALSTYSQEEVKIASDVVNQYYTHLIAGEYRQALALVAEPEDQVRDWSYENQWRSRYLQRLAQSGEYRMLAVGGPELTGGPPHNRPKRQPMTFYTTMYIEQGGKKDMVAENVLVEKVNGQFRIVDVESVDHYVRYRAYEFQLPRVGNPQ